MTDLNEFNRNLIEEFRANGGKVSGMFERSPLVILTTTGAKSGQPRTFPVVYTRDGDRLIVVASKGGSDQNPAWYHNLVAHPTVTVELPDETYQAQAVVVEGDERDRLYRAHADRMPNFDDYQAKTSRRIPVIALERI
jgi:deazaflavin-dependent oxidoreductase (nitroreductase family)